jgi:16S rRNA (adenine1518-N6/adenine1519-N6)-dimethyltransferase
VAVRKRFGQHFLTDRRALERIVRALAPEAGESIVEVGPGRGALTDLLVEVAARVVAVEIDRDLVRLLRARYADKSSVEIVEGDVLRQPLSDLVQGPFSVVGNVPYYITTPIIFHALQRPRPRELVFLVQREVAERVCAPPGSHDYGALTVNVTSVATPAIVGHVPAGAFHPVPKVDSAILSLTPRTEPLCEPGEEEALRELVVGLFGQRRRQMIRALRTVRGLSAEEASNVLQQAAVDPSLRPESLSPQDFVRVLRASAALRPISASDSTARS